MRASIFPFATFVCAKFLRISVIFLVGDEIGWVAGGGLEIAGIGKVKVGFGGLFNTFSWDATFERNYMLHL